ncbi:hypothetical protein OIU77_030866 [Salix suchowensis]|uniref:Uncharacterized protein n=1 Tax=Salix suchowensis TaxID=1278906 RepID=A0ABQ9BDG0_9ROSI|nr:hypothetical protein OIU77_030866 [Salix suchowensis]
MRKIPLQVVAPHGLDNNTLRDPKITELAIREPGVALLEVTSNSQCHKGMIVTWEVSSFVKMEIILMLTPSSALHLVGIGSFTGLSSMKRLLDGRTHLVTLKTMKGIGDIELKRIMIPHQNYDSNHSESDFASDRLALRLSASGPLKLEDVKHAWGMCTEVASRSSPGALQSQVNAVAMGMPEGIAIVTFS